MQNYFTYSENLLCKCLVHFWFCYLIQRYLSVMQSMNNSYGLSRFSFKLINAYKNQSRLMTSLWNKALWLDVGYHGKCINQSECIISEKSSYTTLIFFRMLWEFLRFLNIIFLTFKCLKLSSLSLKLWFDSWKSQWNTICTMRKRLQWMIIYFRRIRLFQPNWDFHKSTWGRCVFGPANRQSSAYHHGLESCKRKHHRLVHTTFVAY